MLHVVTFFPSWLPASSSPSNSPGREEVGRPTLRGYGGFLLPFFYRARFRLSTSTTRKRQARKIYPNKTPIASGVEESNSPRRALLLLLPDSSGGHYLKKKHAVSRTATWRSSNNLPRKSEKSVKVGHSITDSITNSLANTTNSLTSSITYIPSKSQYI